MSQGTRIGRRPWLAAGVLAGLAAPTLRTQAGQTRVLRVGHGHGASGPIATGIAHASNVLHERSAGRLRLEQVPEGRLGSEREMIDLVRERSLDLSLAAPVVLTVGCLAAMILDTPFMARDFEHVQRMFGSPRYQMCMRGLQQGDMHNVYAHELRAFPPWYRGTRHMTTRDRPIRVPDDMAGLRMRVGKGRTIPGMLRAVDAVPVAMSEDDIRAALEAGRIDGQEGPLTLVERQGLLEFQRCLSLTSHVVMSLIPVANIHAWHLLRDAEREALEGALGEGGALCTRLAQTREDELLRAFRQRDIEVVIVYRDAFRRALAPFYEQFRQWWSPGTLEMMEAL